ncbi:hypothetical protein TBLA_0E02500 [Henningerozyma blattae CBS 6284]|uniref:Major facilitator superfamily (MFS) profile domain-containing protein n=1 Tax=Henningerozyma blattae (strain ATCC 34711 / CBS 6284 / DSM 70876 / NBRC 10599 / NRRL Y-10934 / UCD 77-7) TaxID=1071380 RepID=I2H4K2_HENB6|nr:hypothetical protein TBLA_0E02500 [Tetrapisispora blattae CBS 6284]CCH61304.1 hypothetical protein TBLA_0E02500 [Tetrapisispora blattae CBS 6284]
MTYPENFKNTLFVDILEALKIVEFEERPNTQEDFQKVANEDPHSEKLQNSEEVDCDDNDNSNVSNNSPIGHNSERLLNISKSETNNVDKDIEYEYNCSDDTIATDPIDPFLVDWHGPDDPDNPHNWKPWKKYLMMAEIMLLTCINYMGSSIYTPGEEEIQREFHVGHVVATLNLSMYVLGYGIGPMILSPLSEYARFGRLYIYLVTFFMFGLFQVGSATVKTIGGLVVIRFIAGVLCSPALATGGASLSDFLSTTSMPYFLGLWSIGAIAAPVLAPLLGACMVVAKDWRWIFWFLLFLVAALLLVLSFFFPETHAGNILHRRCKRLRKITGDDRYYTAQYKKESTLEVNEFLKKCLLKPFRLIFQEPIILAFDLYTAVAYGIFYLFFEAFPIVFVGIYNFTVIELGLAFLGFCVGCVFAYAIWVVFMWKYISPKFANGTFVPENMVVLGMYLCMFLPLTLFFFGWTAKVHWILPIISELFFVIFTFNLFQITFSYLAIGFPAHVASVYAGNGFCRAALASGFPLFGKAMYDNLGTKNYPVGWGSSLLGFISVALAVIPFVIYKYGAYLRSRSSFTA